MLETSITRRGLTMMGLAMAVTGAAGFASAQDGAAMGARDPARGGRLAVPVKIDGQGPFRFVVDSAANASVIADDLAAALALPDAGVVGMHTLIARETVSTVTAGRVHTGDLNVTGPRLALATRGGLNGADGLIGADLLRGHRLLMSFRGRARVSVSRSRRVADSFLDAARPTARFKAPADSRFGDLLMIDARSRDVAAKAIIDTGAEVTIVNTALAKAANARPATLRDGSRRRRVSSPTGRFAEATPMVLPNLHFAGIGLGNVPVLVGDFHTFALWGFAERPAVLLGVDVLGLFETVIIDLRRGELVLEI